MSHRILMVHFTPPGVIGGVEHILFQHQKLLRKRHYVVDVVAGREGDGDSLQVIPELNVASPESIDVEAELTAGVVSPRFWAIRRRIFVKLAPLVRAADTVIVHNAFTLHFSLPLTAALWELARSAPPSKMIAWSHDLSWTNPLYLPSMHAGYPWDLLRVPAPHTRYVVISGTRQMELKTLWGDTGPKPIQVPNGIDPAEFWRLSPPIDEIARRYRLAKRDIVLLLPVRITRRKNIELALRTVRSLKDRGLDVCFLVSGPVAPHHPGRSLSYLGELKVLCDELDITDEVVFLADDRRENFDSAEVSQLYSLADVLFFPSEQEGFGLPILEAALARVPVVLSDIPIFHEVGGDHVSIVSLHASPDTIAAEIMDALSGRSARLYRRVLHEYRWDAILDRHIVPLLESASS